MKVRILHTDTEGMSLIDCNAGRATILMSWDQLESYIIAGRIKKRGRFIRGRTFTIQEVAVTTQTRGDDYAIHSRNITAP